MTSPLLNEQLLMVQGTTSDAGKSALITALGRLLYRQQQSVAPFKAQNMALNSAVSVEGGEIGRAQAVQALACGVAASTRFNPILLKPTGEHCSQVIVDGHSIGRMDAQHYHAYKPKLYARVMDSLQRLQQDYRFVLIEGAGSPAEINLRQHDLVNMGLALGSHAPVILIADIDRGGVFAHLVGTLALLAAEERQHVIGLVINRFRGDPALLEPGIEWLEQHTQLPVLAVIPWLDQLHLDAEDSLPPCLALPTASLNTETTAIRVSVIALPGWSNRSDIDALRFHPEVELAIAHSAEELRHSDLLVLPGSKRVISDLEWLRQQGFVEQISRHLRYQGKVLGLCGGYQMLGRWLEDPAGYDAPRAPGSRSRVPGLGWLDHTTQYGAEKILRHTTAYGGFTRSDLELYGYEIHVGISHHAATLPFAWYPTAIGPVREGGRSADGQVIGTYLHGVLDTAEALDDLLCWVNPQRQCAPRHYFDIDAYRLSEIDRWADTVARALRFDRWPAGKMKDALQAAVAALDEK